MNLQALTRKFQQNFDSQNELGASVAVWSARGEELCLAGGFQDAERTIPWLPHTPVLVWSATKGPAAACLLHALEASNTPLDTPVSHLWPAFAAAGKQDATVRMLLQHQVGLCALDAPPPVEDHAAVADALARQTPAWKPGAAHGYHPRTFGFLLEEVLRRLGCPDSLGAYWRRVFADPLQLDFWMGLPPALHSRVAPVFSSRGTLPAGDPFFHAFMTPGSLTSRSFASPSGLHSAAAMNTPAARSACYPGFGGIGSARALASFYALLANEGARDHTRFFHPATLAPLRHSGVQGHDRVLCMETAFTCGFMRDPEWPGEHRKKRHTFGPSLHAFGHPGAGGSLAFADPDSGLGFAYVMNQMAPGVLPNQRASGLVEALYSPL